MPQLLLPKSDILAPREVRNDSERITRKPELALPGVKLTGTPYSWIDRRDLDWMESGTICGVSFPSPASGSADSVQGEAKHNVISNCA